MRIFGAERITGLMERLGMEEDVPIEHGLINRAIENAQKKVEGHNFDIRKNLLEYDDVMNQQRKTIYALRRQVLEGRYAPEPTEEEKKKGKTAADVPPPTESGKHTAGQRWPQIVRPMLARMCDALTEARAADPTRADGCAAATATVRRPGAAPLARSTAQFGAYLDTERDRRGSHRDARPPGRARSASSMIQQRERLLDLCEEMLQRSSTSTARPTRTPRTGTSRRSRAAVKERFGFEPDDRRHEGRSSARRSVESLWDEVEKVIEAREAELAAARPAVLRALLLPRGDRRALDRAPQGDGGAARGHRPARLRPEGSEAGVQEGRLRRSSAR